MLHILKEEPDGRVDRIIELQSRMGEVEVVRLYEGEVDYEKLLELIFSCDRVISW